MSTKVKELSSSGKVKTMPVVTGNLESGINGEKPDTEAQSTLPSKSSPLEQKSSLLTPEKLLLIFQEDLRNLKESGIDFVILPNLKGVDGCGIVLKNVGFENGDFVYNQ